MLWFRTCRSETSKGGYGENTTREKRFVSCKKKNKGTKQDIKYIIIGDANLVYLNLFVHCSCL